MALHFLTSQFVNIVRNGDTFLSLHTLYIHSLSLSRQEWGQQIYLYHNDIKRHNFLKGATAPTSERDLKERTFCFFFRIFLSSPFYFSLVRGNFEISNSKKFEIRSVKISSEFFKDPQLIGEIGQHEFLVSFEVEVFVRSKKERKHEKIRQNII